MKARIFVVEDNDNLREAVVSYLELENYEVEDFCDLESARRRLWAASPDLLILDVMLPDGNGFHFAREVRRRKMEAPIIFLTAKGEESDRITGFEVGGDDYLVKPFSMKELVLRVTAVLKRLRPASGPEAGKGDGSVPEAGEAAPAGTENKALEQFILQHVATGRTTVPAAIIEIDTESHRLRHGPWNEGKTATQSLQETQLTPAEWEVCLHLSRHPGQVFSREQLLNACFGYLADGYERTIDTHIKNIRQKLGNRGWIETVRGYGYRFAGTPLPASAGSANAEEDSRRENKGSEDV
ncbi:MAG: response regulator transcription factor [Spirochaetales bacterium]|nr:response regulator transcription factor [Spirochaetales bacterium]MCF7938071.1 response regulator transcription factor [Spirochaetales bacterium]